MTIEQYVWGFTDEGEAVIRYTMTNACGAYVKLTNIGATIVGIGVPDRDGRIEDIALGFADFNDYFGDSAYLGKTCGRIAGRISRSRFTLNGTEYKLPANNGPNQLHGGPGGLSGKIWDARVETNRVVFSYTSPDGEERYPGTVGIEVVYDWDDNNELEITFHARTDAPTILNLTNHVYFNLKGEGNGDIHSHELQFHASRFLPTTAAAIPTGEQAPVAGTPMDFLQPKPVGKEIGADFEQLRFGSGYDHYWIADDWKPGQVREMGNLYEPSTGRLLTIESDQAGIVFYTGNFLDGIGKNKKGGEHTNRSGLALECQNYPDAPNHPDFPSVVLNPDEEYESHVIYRFSVR